MRRVLIFFITNYLMVDQAWGNSKVRTIEMERDQVALIRTAMGVATIVEVPDAPSSVVVGNPESFKVEYLDKAITLKPVTPNAKSNMYIYTDYRRYNTELVVVDLKRADYVVYLKNKSNKNLEHVIAQAKRSSSEIKWRSYVKKLSCGKFLLQIKRVGLGGGSVLIDFEIKSLESGKIDPKIFWIKQLNKVVTIQTLLFTRLDYAKNHNAQGVMEIKASDLGSEFPFILEVRDKKTFSLTIRRTSKWKYL